MLLYGASGHAKVVCSALESVNEKINTIFDDNPRQAYLHEYKVQPTYNPEFEIHDEIIISIGDNSIRKKISQWVKHPFGKCIAANASCDKTVIIGDGTVILHNAVVQRDTTIGKHCIINTSSSVDHDCFLEDYVHISPGVTICGGVNVGEGAHIGAGAIILPNIRIGKWCIIGAGSIVLSDIPDFAVVVGNPGKVIKMLK